MRDKWEKANEANIASVQKKIDAIYKEAVREAAAIGVAIKDVKDKPFTFEQFPSTRKRVEKMMQQMGNRMEYVIASGIRASWDIANEKDDALVLRVFGSKAGKLTDAQKKRYFNNNSDALEAFIKRKTEGLDLSDRVWKYTDMFKEEIEMGLDLGIREGRSAQEMSRDLRSYLQYPDKLFRRIRDEHGNLQLSKTAKAFHPGQGVYRSSYKNARRLAATETNMAYRTSDHERWQQFDFVVGIEVHLSNNHTCLGTDGKPHLFSDICDSLAGKYPKDFKFLGWHPHCRCFATSILKTPEELAADTQNLLEGKPLEPSSQEVGQMPEFFKSWCIDNARRIETSKALPYFIKDNTDTIVPMLCRTSAPPKDVIRDRAIAARLLRSDNHYKDVMFDGKTGGLKATHVDHNFADVGGKYEKEVQEAGFKDGHAVILGSEKNGDFNVKFTEGTWNGLQFEVMGCETATDNNYLRGLCHCADKKTTDVAVLHFPNGGFDANKMRRALGRYNGLEKLNDGQFLEFKSVVCIQDGKVVYNEAFKKGAGGSTSVVYPPHISKSGTAKVGNKPEPAKTKEQLLEEQKQKKAILKNKDSKIETQADEIEAAIGVKRGEPMTFEQADELRANPHYVERSASGYTINCQSSVVANELRRRGYDVEAMMNTRQNANKSYQLSQATEKAWIDPATGKAPKVSKFRCFEAREDFWVFRDLERAYANENGIEALINEPADMKHLPIGRYHMRMRWKGDFLSEGGHIVTFEKTGVGQYRFLDAQTGSTTSLCKLLKYAESEIEYYRVDTLTLNPEFAGVVAKAGTTKPSTVRYAKKKGGWSGAMDTDDIEAKVKAITTPRTRNTYVSFEPFSPILLEKLNALRDKKQKIALFNELAEDQRTEVLKEVGTAKTVMFPGHHGASTDSWKATKQMAEDINKHGESVIFLPEKQGKTSADAFVLFNGRPVIADFKHSEGTNWNTLQKDLAHGFDQAGTIVLKLEKMDAGGLKETIDYLIRNGIKMGNIKLLNKYGKFVELSSKDLQYGSYKKKIKGFL